MIILRNSSALFFSFLVHASIAAGAVTLYNIASESIKQVHQNKPLCLCLSKVQTEPELPKEEMLPVVIPPVPEKILKPVPKILPKPVVKKVAKPIPKVKEVVQKPQPDIVEKIEKIEEIHLAATEVIQEVLPVVSEVQPYRPSPKERYLQEHLQIIAQMLRQNLYYPTRARKRHIEGEVVMVFELLQNGNIGAVNIKQGAQSILNSAAIKTVNKLSGKVPKPSETISIEIPIQFKLTS